MKKKKGRGFSKIKNGLGNVREIFVVLLAILAVGVGSSFATAVVMNYEELWSTIQTSFKQVVESQFGWGIFFNVLIILGMVLFVKFQDKNGAINWEAVSKTGFYGSLVGVLVFLNLMFVLVLVLWNNGTIMIKTIWDTMTDPHVVATAVSAVVIIAIIVIAIFASASKHSSGNNDEGNE